MDKTVDPLTEEELRKHACKYDTLGFGRYNGYFPIESMAEIQEEKCEEESIESWWD